MAAAVKFEDFGIPGGIATLDDYGPHVQPGETRSCGCHRVPRHEYAAGEQNGKWVVRMQIGKHLRELSYITTDSVREELYREMAEMIESGEV